MNQDLLEKHHMEYFILFKINKKLRQWRKACLIFWSENFSKLQPYRRMTFFIYLLEPNAHLSHTCFAILDIGMY